MQQFQKDLLLSMDLTSQELEQKLKPIFNNKVKYVNGKLLKDIFKDIKDIIQCHNHLRRNIENEK